MALGEDEAEVEASVETKAQSCGRWNCGEQDLLPQGPEPQQLPHLEVEGAPVWRTEADPACTSGAFLSRAHVASREPVADGSKLALSGPLPPASMGTGDLLHSMGSQAKETKLSASQSTLQSVNVLRSTAVCSGQNSSTQDDASPVDSPPLLDLSQQPHVSGFPFLSPWKSTENPGAPQLSSRDISASSTGSSFLDHQEKVEPPSGSFAKVSSLELIVPPGASSVAGPGPRWSPQPKASGGDVIGLGRRQLSFQAEYWACVLPDSLPPSPDRHSPLWNPNKEYEDLLNYTYPLRPGPQLPKQSESHVLTDPVMQDSGVDLDSFSVSPASTLKSPTNVSPNCSSAEVPALPFSGAREPCLKQWPLGVPQKQGSIGLASWNQLASSTPKAPDTDSVPWESREAALRDTQDYLPTGKHFKVDSPQLRTREQGLPLLRPEREKRASQSVWHPACVKPTWKSEEEMDCDDEYLALPTRLTQVSSLVSYLGAVPTFVSLPTMAAEGQSSLGGSDSGEPASPTVDSTQRQRPSSTAFRGPEGQNSCFLHSIHPRDSTVLMSSQALGVSSGLLKTHPSLPAVSDKWPFSEADVREKLPRKAGEQDRASLVQCVQTFCCQLEELIHWLYNVTDVADLGSPPRSSLTGLKSSLQLYRQFKKDVDEHQSLTESVLEKGEVLLQCLLDNTPVLSPGNVNRTAGDMGVQLAF
ncbi:centrosomal protein of 68 kDa isoform X2 [Nannospalax galili]|uniref:centrosomal protein of 68 kDa isoform X2 n=1 Tax=Nannospalax galili TaxID=1026970 RepID=UPI00081A0A89|nr:centrosomal protein of 68 kDa isoform X2 [Nannospalax galili]